MLVHAALGEVDFAATEISYSRLVRCGAPLVVEDKRDGGRNQALCPTQAVIDFVTVRSYRKTMMGKLGVNNIAGLTQVALASGVTRLPLSIAAGK